MDRIVNCIGSLYGPDPDTSSSPAAREGTACHALLETCIGFDMPPREFLGSTQFSKEFPVTVEMVDGVELFIQEVRAVMAECGIPLDRAVPERRISHPAVANDLFGGTMDFQAIGDDTLIIADLKYGRRQVYADSKQLTAYSILSMSALPAGHGIKRIIQMIIQPRGNPQVSRHEIGQTEIGELWAAIKQAEAYVLSNPDLTVRAPLEVLNAGPHCKYCPVRVGCPQRDGMAEYAIKQCGTVTVDEKGANVFKPRDTFDMSVERLVMLHEHGDMLREFLSDVEIALKTRASQGVPIPGYKLLMSYGRRAFTEEEDKVFKKIARMFKATVGEETVGVKSADFYVKQPMSVKQTEDFLKEKGILSKDNPNQKELKAKFAELTESKPTGVRLASSKAKGEAVRPEVAVEFLKDVKDMIEDEHE